MSGLFGRVRALESMLSFTKAKSLEGAMAQVATAAEWAQSMIETEMTSEEVVELGQEMLRLLYSAAAVLEQETGVPRDEYVAEQYMPPRLDPHAQLDRPGEARAA